MHSNPQVSAIGMHIKDVMLSGEDERRQELQHRE